MFTLLAISDFGHWKEFATFFPRKRKKIGALRRIFSGHSEPDLVAFGFLYRKFSVHEEWEGSGYEIVYLEV